MADVFELFQLGEQPGKKCMSTFDSLGKGGGRVNWDRVAAMTAEEIEADAALERAELRLRPSDEGAVPVTEFLTRNVRDIRGDLQLSQRGFAMCFGLSLRTVQQWEQGRAQPDQSAKILLLAIEAAPHVIRNIVARARRSTRAIGASSRGFRSPRAIHLETIDFEMREDAASAIRFNLRVEAHDANERSTYAV